MASLVALASGLLLVCAAAFLLMRRRRVGFSALQHASVSRQWLIEHQGDDRS